MDIDVDDYDDTMEATEHVDALRSETLAVASAHTTPDRPGHLFVLVDGDPRAVVRDVLGRGVDNPTASFGEIRIANQYVVGPGSDILCRCDRCASDEADERGYGSYELANAVPPVVWSEREFEEFLRTDPAIEPTARAPTPSGEGEPAGGRTPTESTLSDDVDARLTVARTADEYVEQAIRDAAAAPDDRSRADATLARRVAPWLCNDRQAIADVLDRHGSGKWATRTDDSYRNSILDYATEREITYEPIPYWALLEFALAEGVVDEADLVSRRSGDGAVVGDPEAVDADTYRAFPDTETYNAALEAIAEAGVSHGRTPVVSGGSGAGGGQYELETYAPPTRDTVPFDAGTRYQALQGERFETALASDALVVPADAPGAGKTLNTGLAALDRDVSHFYAFDKHRKAREYVTDETLPDEAEYHHQKGTEQKRLPQCMDADHADEECPQHGHPSQCPSMCPANDLDRDDDRYQQYKAIEREVGPLQAHLILDLDDEQAHPWHGGECAWQQSYAAAEAHANVAGVHPCLTQQLASDGELTVVDETPDLNARDRTLSVEDLTRLANALESVADVQPRDEPIRYTALSLSTFARELVDVLTDAPDAPTSIAALDPPTVIWTAYETYDDAAGHYVERQPPDDDWQLAEALASAKVTYGETIRRRMEREEWAGAPLSLDPLLAATVTAGLEQVPVMRAVAVPPMLTACPWCRTDLVADNGGRRCAADGCDWTERENAYIRAEGEPARALAWIATDHNDTPVGLAYRALPLPSDLPDPSDTLVLDATATSTKLACLFDIDRERVTVTGDEQFDVPGLRVHQIPGAQYHKSTITQSDSARERIQRIIDKGAEFYDRPLFVLAKQLKPLFDVPDNAEVLHYHATRGLNRSDCDAVFCLGAPHPDVEDLRRDAQLLGMHRDDIDIGGAEYSTRRDAPNPPVYRKLHYEDENGDGRAVPTKHYSGLVGDLFREAREKELEQTVHRIHPLHADAEEPVDAYLLTNVPTRLTVDELTPLDELADPLEAFLPVPRGALDLLDAVHDVVEGDAPDGFRAAELVERHSDGSVANKVSGYHRLAQFAGVTPRGNDGPPARRTVYNWVDALEDVGLLHPEDYEQHAGVSYAVDLPTLQSALSILSHNVGFKAAAVRRFRTIAERSDGSLGWLEWAKEALGLRGDRCMGDPPPGGANNTPG